MRTKIGVVLMFIGGFLLMFGILAQTYGASKLEKTPLDVDSTTRLAGEATLNGPDGEDSFPVNVTSITRADSEKSDGDVIVFVNSSCVVRDEGDPPDCVSNDDPQERLLTASTDTFSTDRETGLAVNDPEYLPASAEPHEGLVNKFPFGSEKKTYPYWSRSVGDTVDAVYDREDDLDGLKTYVYTVEIDEAPIEIAEGVDGLYNESTEIWVEPVTGAIVDQTTLLSRTTEDGELVLSLDYSFTDDQVAESIDDAKGNSSKLDLLTSVVPIVGYVVGHPADPHRPGADRARPPRPPRWRPGGHDLSRAVGGYGRQSARNTAVPGVTRPRTADQPPQIRSCPSGHSGSSRVVSTNPALASRATQSPSVRWCST